VGRRRQPQAPEIRRTPAGRFGARLAALAEKAELTADQLAAKLGKTGDMVRLYYSGRSVPHINDWPKLARALGVTMRELLPE
jgi:transcriptional regulator with XRE-family HTH domain